ncbi:MAG TPA: SAM-dependent methyltransferase [Pyrinomonadaceae bacterium]|nr:SAM-dependent methyltransferase [Pyrinomonadaceae bacterium]
MKEDRPSATAYLIARSTFFLSRDPLLGRLVPPRSAELSRRFAETRSRLARWLDDALNSRLLRPLSGFLERATVPGIRLHYALRKRYLEETARRALGEGFPQMVVIGAGFDTLALRLHEAFPETEFFEVDHPATQRVKKRVIESQDSPAPNLHFISLDLTHGNLEGSLLPGSAYRADLDTVFVAEGLLMYLAPAEVELILQFIRHHSGAHSKFVFTFMETQSDGRIGFRQSSRAVDAWLRLRGESFKWGIHHTRLSEFLAARGFVLRELVTSEMLRSKYLAAESLKALTLADGECLCVCEPDSQ